MEHQKILNLLHEASNSKFITKKWNIVNDQSIINYDVEIVYITKIFVNTMMLTF